MVGPRLPESYTFHNNVFNYVRLDVSKEVIIDFISKEVLAFGPSYISRIGL